MGAFISHVQVPVRDMQESIKWYVQCLGCEFITEFQDFAILEFSQGANLFLWQSNDQTTNNFTINGDSWPSIGIQVDDIDKIRTQIIESGVEYEGDGLATPDNEGRRFFRFFDLNGNMLVAHQEPEEAQ